MRRNFFILIILSIGILSCEKTPQHNNQPPLIDRGKGVFIINEGNYGGGNGSVSYYRIDSNKVYNDIFFTVNQRPLGDVCQAMYIFNNNGYIIVNNSRKIEIVEVGNFKSKGTITGFTSPRCMLATSQSVAYVSDMYSDFVSVVNLGSNTITGSIHCPGSTEDMIIADNKVFITNTEKEYVYIADPATNQITDSLHLSYGSFSTMKDKEGKLWILCMGDYRTHTNACLFEVNPVSRSIEKTLPFTSWLNAWNKLRMNPSKDTLYYSDGNIFRMSIQDNTLPADTFIRSGNKNFYGLGIDPESGNIYISDAIDYVQRGKVYIYSSKGNLLQSFNAGIIPGEFCFY